MIQSILFFVLGFVSAAFVALLLAPSIWRRAVTLTRRRIEATVPMTLNEIQAEKDRMRAEFAMSMRRLEMSVQSHRNKIAVQEVEVSRLREEISALAEEGKDKGRIIGELEIQLSRNIAEREKAEERLQQVEEQKLQASSRLDERAQEFEALSRRLEEANFTASNNQIELVARETEIDKLIGDINLLRARVRGAEKEARDKAAEGQAAMQALRVERQRSAELERRIEGLMTTLSDREDRIERREREIAQLRDLAGAPQQPGKAPQVPLGDSEPVPGTATASAQPADRPSSPNGESENRGRLEDRLTALVRQNKKLRAAMAQKSEAGAGDEYLRTEILSLAAQVVSLTALVEGGGSPIPRILADAPADGPTPSLADRIHSLQKTAALSSRD